MYLPWKLLTSVFSKLGDSLENQKLSKILDFLKNKCLFISKATSISNFKLSTFQEMLRFYGVD